jgi:hypothetical protein
MPYHVRVLVPCYKEDLVIVRRTVMAAYLADLPDGCSRTIYICDDGKDPKKRKFCDSMGPDVRCRTRHNRCQQDTLGPVWHSEQDTFVPCVAALHSILISLVRGAKPARGADGCTDGGGVTWNWMGGGDCMACQRRSQALLRAPAWHEVGGGLAPQALLWRRCRWSTCRGASARRAR